MSQHALEVLEFTRVLERVATRASSELGRQKILALRPTSEPDSASRELARVAASMRFVEGAPENISVLIAAAQLYSAYGVVFVDDPVRARKLTSRGWSYGQRALCAAEELVCGVWNQNYDDFVFRLHVLGEKEVEALYTLGLSWIAYIQAHSDD